MAIVLAVEKSLGGWLGFELWQDDGDHSRADSSFLMRADLCALSSKVYEPQEFSPQPTSA